MPRVSITKAEALLSTYKADVWGFAPKEETRGELGSYFFTFSRIRIRVKECTPSPSIDPETSRGTWSGAIYCTLESTIVDPHSTQPAILGNGSLRP